VNTLRSLPGLTIKGIRVLLREGPRSFYTRTRKAIRTRILGQSVHLAVGAAEAAEVDWTDMPPQLREPISVADGPTHIAWIMSPPSETSGGHQNLFRFIAFAEQAGHTCSVYFYTSTGIVINIPEMSAMLAKSAAYPHVAASLANYDPVRGVDPRAQAIFATGWETAYPVFLDPSSARRFYFVQDYEPSFYAAGTEAVLAENTYRFGFHGITAGGWLSTKLRDEFGMHTDHFDFGADHDHYNIINRTHRDEIFFYARPPTARRGFELGVLALAEFARENPDVKINLAGWDVSNFNLPFKFTNHSGLAITELNGLYNRCAAGLVLSFSNMSLLPLELMASGVIPVVNDAPNTRMVADSPFISYVPPAPRAIARALAAAIHREDQVENAVAMSDSIDRSGWGRSARQFVEAYERAMRG